MTALTRHARVVHNHPLRSYGPGELLEHDGPGRARVLFRDGTTRLVRTDDLSIEPAVPHVARPVQRVVYPRSAA